MNSDDPRTLELLDGYITALHTGRDPERDRLLTERPELAATLDCLESLERLGVSATTSDAPTLAPDAAPTVDTTGVSGSVFGRYELLRELGRGGMGVVYEARQTALDRIVALKMILGSHLATREQVERFQIEARAAGRLRHPNVVQVYEAGEVEGQHYFAMQYIAGCGLDRLLAQRSLSPEEAVRVVRDTARAVQYLHEQGLLHRDLKPANILVDSAGHPYLTDFGLARALEGDLHLTQTGAILGTPSYMAPEQAAARKDIGPRCDVYGLGAILYECLTGRPPFREATPLDTIVQVIEGEPTMPRRVNPAVPVELELICLKCLEKLPERRYATAAELADDLDRYLQGEAVAARPQGLWQRLTRWWRREPALVARLAGLLLFTVVIQLHYVWAGADEDFGLHVEVLAVTGLWMAAAWVCQRLLAVERLARIVRYTWCGVEPFLLTALLALTGNATSPLTVVFAVLVAASGLWFRVGLVNFTTVTAQLAFALLVVLSPPLQRHPHHTLIFLVCLGVLGLVVGHQVQRVRVLSRHYENRPLP